MALLARNLIRLVANWRIDRKTYLIKFVMTIGKSNVARGFHQQVKPVALHQALLITVDDAVISLESSGVSDFSRNGLLFRRR